MATCLKCGASIGFFSGSVDYCLDCTVAKYKAGARERVEAQRSAVTEIELRNADIDAIVLTTETAPNLKITKRIEIVTAEVAYGMNIFKDLFAGVRDIVGGRSEAVQKTMRDARRTALYELKKEAHSVGANAVVGVDLDYVELSGSSNMVMLVASGTAVIIEDEGL
jgi:uncharacterized protein YbjQ (UPF0145 family)